MNIIDYLFMYSFTFEKKKKKKFHYFKIILKDFFYLHTYIFISLEVVVVIYQRMPWIFRSMILST